MERDTNPAWLDTQEVSRALGRHVITLRRDFLAGRVPAHMAVKMGSRLRWSRSFLKDPRLLPKPKTKRD